jgi:hypothetical protein
LTARSRSSWRSPPRLDGQGGHRGVDRLSASCALPPSPVEAKGARFELRSFKDGLRIFFHAQAVLGRGLLPRTS